MVQPNYCIVKQNVGALIEDSPGDYDRYPDFKEVTGEVLFTPMLSAGQSFQLTGSDGEMYTVPITRIRGTIVEGKIWHEGEEGVPLFAGGEGANPSSVGYRVTYSRLFAGVDPIQLNPIAFTAIPGATIDLTTVTPISNAPVSGVIKGDKGDKGDQGPEGKMGPSGGVTDDGYRTRTVEVPASEYPGGISIGYHNLSTANWSKLFIEAGLSESTPNVTVITIRPFSHADGNTRQIVWGYNKPKLPMVTRSWDLTNNKWGAATLMSGATLPLS